MVRLKYGEESRLAWDEMMELSGLGGGTGSGNDENQSSLSDRNERCNECSLNG